MSILSIFLKPFGKKAESKNFLFLLGEEMNTNLERFYVIDQRQFITSGFEVRAWKEAKELSGIKFPDAILDYGNTLEDFNATLDDICIFEKYYLRDASTKTQENAQRLHDKKEFLDQKLQPLQKKIVVAQKALGVIMEKNSHA